MAPIERARASGLSPAAQYLRMSTEHQRYSIEHQTLANTAYAVENGFEIIRTYADAGISGLTLEKRDGLKQLLADVLGGRADFSEILVYDVSRWGRFQDPDEAAHYEFICKAAGVRIAYCAELFENDGSLTSTLVKHMKRAMAAEYSRELSNKVINAKRNLGLQGCWPGGNPGFGFRRCSADASGLRQTHLDPGEANVLKGNRITIIRGPPDEVATVRRIFRLFVSSQIGLRGIAKKLNGEGRRSWGDGLWTESRIRRLLQNDLYVGSLMVGKTETHLGVVVRRPKAEWTRVTGACEPLVSQKDFQEAQRRIRHWPRYTREKLLADLRTIWAEQGRLSYKLIKEDPRTAGPSVYRRLFGSIDHAYGLIGYTMSPTQKGLTERIAPYRPFGSDWNCLKITDEELLARLRLLLEKTGRLSIQSIEVTPGLPRSETLARRFGSIERTYELVGFVPSPRQRQCFDRQRSKAQTGATRRSGDPRVTPTSAALSDDPPRRD